LNSSQREYLTLSTNKREEKHIYRHIHIVIGQMELSLLFSQGRFICTFQKREDPNYILERYRCLLRDGGGRERTCTGISGWRWGYAGIPGTVGTITVCY
jgi:hypothetical protein